MHDVGHWKCFSSSFKLFLEIVLRLLLLVLPRVCSSLLMQAISFTPRVAFGVVFVAGVCGEVIC